MLSERDPPRKQFYRPTQAQRTDLTMHSIVGEDIYVIMEAVDKAFLFSIAVSPHSSISEGNLGVAVAISREEAVNLHRMLGSLLQRSS